jgi:uncharacterized protein (DUF58 family)
MESSRLIGRFARGTIRVLWPNHRLRIKREGFWYLVIWSGLLTIGLFQQINLILLVAGLAAGPIAASWLVSAGMLRKLRVARRVPAFVFSGEPLRLDYTLENSRRWTASLALDVEDALAPVDRMVSGADRLLPSVFFARVPGGGRERLRWERPSPKRGKYRFSSIDLVTRAPFGLWERRCTYQLPDELIVYPTVGQLSRRWHLLQREATETKRGQRHDRSAQQQEYHGLRDYRPGDSPRWIHWRTSARLAKPMVKEFEQQNEQDLFVLIDPWLPRIKVTPEQRETLEEAIRFVASVCLETCRFPGRRLLLGWTGPTPGVRQGPATVKLLHELLEQLATMRPSSEGQLSTLFDVLPASTLWKAILVIVSTRPINLVEDAERSVRLTGASGRGLLGRVIQLDASRGDLADLVQYTETLSASTLPRRVPDLSAQHRAATAPEVAIDSPDLVLADVKSVLNRHDGAGNGPGVER